MNRIVRLVYKGETVGFRSYLNNRKDQVFDVSIEVANQLGIPQGDVQKSITLKDSNGILLSQSERDGEYIAKEISDDLVLVRQYFLPQQEVESPVAATVEAPETSSAAVKKATSGKKSSTKSSTKTSTKSSTKSTGTKAGTKSPSKSTKSAKSSKSTTSSKSRTTKTTKD